ncbi:MAG: carboxymuconolactone decarboxylase family protein [Candidatus Gastranaerophilales bacterium]|nr:carboxymuconolactone decarboxylase family protein [Candidatus Gastranaerophilales bacterium]
MANRINLLNPNEASEQAQNLLEQVKGKFGKVPNIFKLMANSPAVLQAYLNFNDALAHGKLDSQIKERIGLLLAQKNSCEYCLAAHSLIAKSESLSEQEIMLARQGKSENPKAQAALSFAGAILEHIGNIDDASLNNIRQAGFSDEEILEIVAAVALNFLTNSLNNVAQTQVDFPKAKTCSVCS